MKKIDFRVALPNLITILGLCLGLSSLKYAFEGDFEKALIFIVLASILDALDGRIARFIKGTSKFGAELDSLTDFVNFGVCPSIIIYFWILSYFGFYGWLVSLIFTVSCCLRLARFNLDSNEKVNTNQWRVNCFTGVPAPAGAGLVLLPMILNFSQFKDIIYLDIKIIPIITLAVSFLMISKIPSYSFKKLKLTKSSFLILALGTVIFFSLLFKNTFETLTILGILYFVSLPISYIHFLKLKKKYDK